jgi:hypothetical protein
MPTTITRQRWNALFDIAPDVTPETLNALFNEAPMAR